MWTPPAEATPRAAVWDGELGTPEQGLADVSDAREIAWQAVNAAGNGRGTIERWCQVA
jgi:hypothetical protein